MVELTSIETMIMTYAPMLTTIIAIIVAFVKMIGVIKSVRNDNNKDNEQKTEEIKKLRDEMSLVLNDNAQLKQTIAELLQKIDKIKR